MVKRLRGVCDPDPIQQDNKRSLLKQQTVLRNFLLHNHSSSSSSITIEIHHQQQQSAPQSTTLSTSFTSSRPTPSNTNINNNINQIHYLVDLTHNDTPNNNDPHSNDDHSTPPPPPPPSIHSSCSASSINSSILKCNYNLKEIKQQYKTNNTTEIRSPDTNNINEEESIEDSSDSSSDDDDIEDGDTLNSESDRSVDTNSDMSQEYSIITENLYFLDDVSHHDEMIQCGLCNTTTTVTITNARYATLICFFVDIMHCMY